MKTAIAVSVSPTSFEALAMSEDVEAAFSLAAECGFQGVEIAVRDPALVSAARLRALAEKHGLAIAAVGTGQAYLEEGLSLTAEDDELRNKAIERMKAQLELAGELSAAVIVGLIRGNAKKREVPAALERLREALLQLAEYAVDAGTPFLALEPINRYETRLLNSVEETALFLDSIDHPKLKLLADTFHMNIEDRDMAEALKKAGPRLGHIHIADSNRKAPGLGHICFPPLLRALREVGYKEWLSAEILPEPSPQDAMRLTGAFFKKLLEEEG